MSLSEAIVKHGVPSPAVAMNATMKHQPVAPKESIVQGDKWRITILFDGLIRFEWSDEGKFEDRASTFAINRAQPTPKFEVVERENQIEIITDRVHIEYDRKAFSPSGLIATLRAGEAEQLVGDDSDSGFCGWSNCALGWSVVQAWHGRSGGLQLDDVYRERLGRFSPGTKDLYLFAYGKDYHAALKAYYDVSGHCPILPRWCLGNWWSRYYPYSQDEYLGLMDKFKQEQIPLSVAVIDMDWHVVNVEEKFRTGWTGWTWNEKLFPDHVEFLKQLHDRGLKTTLNTHPSDGVRSYEAIYPEMCKALGRDPKLEHLIAFDPTDPEFLDAYFNILHRSLEKEGVDFWWPDWQQGEISKTGGIDPLWMLNQMLNHYHFLDHAKDGNRPMGFSRYAGPAGQRYPIGFSGDTVISWDSIKYQPEFTATASNIGFGWWSHDIGGHHEGYKDDELQARWVQVGLWSPILRLHCSTGVFYAREPWRFNDESREAATRALRFRYRLVPYLYTMAVRSAVDGHSLIEPLHYDYPSENLAYEYKNTFRYGIQLIAAPVTSPRIKSTTFAQTPVWVPPGRYVDIFTGGVYDGDRVINFHRPLDKIPVLAAEGAIVPLDNGEVLENGCPLPEKMEILLVVGADGQFELVEDDGTGESVDRITFSKTLISYSQNQGKLTIAPASIPLLAKRQWSIRLLAYTPDTDKINVSCATCGGKHINFDLSNVVSSSDPNGWTINIESYDTDKEIVVELGFESPQLDKRDLNDQAFKVIDAAEIGNLVKHALWEVVKTIGTVPLNVLVSRIQAQECDEHVREALLEVLLADSRN